MTTIKRAWKDVTKGLKYKSEGQGIRYMRKWFKNKKIRYLVIIVILLVLVAGCAKITDEKGHILPEFIISLSTSFKDMMENDSWFSALLVWPMAQIVNYTTPYVTVLGAIITVTIVINLLTLSFTVKSTVSSQKMQMIQPELNKIQEKYKDRKDQNSQMQQAQEMNNLYAKHGINPLSTLLVTFLQFPIIIAMYRAVQRAEAVVNAEFLGVKLVESPMYGLKEGQIILFIIFLVMAVAQFGSMMLPQYLAKKRAEKNRRGGQEEPKQSNMAMMLPMLAMVLILAINWPTAMSLYWMVTSVVSIVKTYYIQWRYIDNEKV